MSLQNAHEDIPGLDRKLVHGLAWSGVMRWSGQAAAWLSTLVVARILVPEDYGLVALGSVYVGIVTLLTEFGFGSAIVMLRSLDPVQVAKINGLAILAGLVGFLMSFVVARPLGDFLSAPALPPVIVVLSFAFVLSAPRIAPQSLLQKELRFRALSIIDGIQALTQAVSMLIFALMGMRYWALVASTLTGHAVATTLIVGLRRTPIAWPRRRGLGDALRFSRDVAVARLAWYGYSNADYIVSGKVLGEDATGHYSLAWSLASIPVDKISAIVQRVAAPFFSAVQHDAVAMRRYLLLLVELLALVTFPLSIGIALTAPAFVPLILTEKWNPIILPLQLLSVYGTVRAVSPLFTHVLTACGEQRFAMWNNLLAAALLPTGFVLGARWGTAGIALAWVILHPLIIGQLYRRTTRVIGLRFRHAILSVWPAGGATIAMVLGVLALRAVVEGHLSTIWGLVLDVSAGASTYLLVLTTLHKRRLKTIITFVKNAQLMRRQSEGQLGSWS